MFAYCSNNPVNYYDKSGHMQNPFPVDSPGWLGWELGELIAGIPSKEEHYNRNENQSDISQHAEEIITSKEWGRQPDNRNIYHRHKNGMQGEDAADNVKYMTLDGHYEVVINLSDPDNPYIVTDPYNQGTYNYGNNDIEHFFWDILPYWIHGNTPEDSGIEHLGARVFGAK